ncbi:class I SAM-dependent methyltransferase [Aurantibacillus circumpalustris]|uniref:class I SAM-dependent methyltransferase n=1 Tax=Aurantibacillus circumpalustris TaxID=3036359 RepID=UPI00295AAA51|nr:class I SAM-dependent methyltransferase [Aurantibacillus circumpalustris]
MTWEETIIYARSQNEFKQLIQDAYLDEDLQKNCETYRKSKEFKASLNLIKQTLSKKDDGEKKTLLDLGAGNGICTVAFALENFTVVAVEPDPSMTVGSGAIQQLKNQYHIADIDIQFGFGESLPFADASFDVVYARQVMHHAQDLNQFISESARVLKKGGLLITVRDHVVNDQEQKKEFLENHAFQKYYGGENAFSVLEYTSAFKAAGLMLDKTLGPLDSPINYSPRSKNELTEEFKRVFQTKFGIKLPNVSFINNLIFKLFKWRTKNLNAIAGRLYTFIAIKPNH